MTNRHTARSRNASTGLPPWLLAAADSPSDTAPDWRDHPAQPRLLATGRTFDAVVVSDALGIRTLEAYRAISAPPLPTVIDHQSRKVAFLIASYGLDFWAATLGYLHGKVQYRYLADGDFLLVPGPVPETGARHQWLCPPGGRPSLNAGAVVMLAGHLVASSWRMNKEAMRDAR